MSRELYRLRRAYESLGYDAHHLALILERLAGELSRKDRKRYEADRRKLQRRISKPVGWGCEDHIPNLYRWNRRPDIKGRRKRKRGQKQRGQRHRSKRTKSRKAKR